jgi:hypothetical protein
MIALLMIYAVTSVILIFIGDFEEFPHFLVLDAFFGASLSLLTAMSVFVHVKHLLTGRTTMELELNICVDDGLTPYQRFQEVFGPPSILWILPTPLDYAAVSPFKWESLRPKSLGEEANVVEDKEKQD